MKSMQFLVFFLFLISLKSFISEPVPTSVYYYADSLLKYFQNDYKYWTQQSVFFQFDSYLSQNEIENILSIMHDIYARHNLYGIFLVFDAKVGINDISYYASEIAWNLHYYMGYNRDRAYVIIIEYTVGDYGSQWENKIIIQSGGQSCLPGDVTNLINEYSPSLQNYNYYNVLKFFIGFKNYIDYYRDYNIKESIEYAKEYNKVRTYFTIILFLSCCAFILYGYFKKKKKKKICDHS